MTLALTYTLLITLLLAPFALTAALAAWARRDDYLDWKLEQFRFTAPMVGNLFDPVESGVRSRRR
ncbi:hypothetical protein BVC93_09525 [Mycobacterium sp. MS1601]|uniref:hypothetical protein n=1 Tax=Mycobacterium sp. MS1601 TaxID=1936029 RepID=UPI0009793619|nr:hypothetical protein [Mycobacterium sp. MS1601]AQA02633.1 hypothetical protein BVC93_09525 [Mycobacterium sp. MS1601]